MSLIWSNQVDKHYDVSVTRDNDTHSGRLVVRDGEVVLMDKATTISYGAPFGVDAGDESRWCTEAIEVVDEYIAAKKAGKIFEPKIEPHQDQDPVSSATET